MGNLDGGFLPALNTKQNYYDLIAANSPSGQGSQDKHFDFQGKYYKGTNDVKFK